MTKPFTIRSWRMTLVLASVIALAAGFLVAVPRTAEAVSAGQPLKGTVLNGVTSAPISGALVQARYRWSTYCQTTTDDTGDFSLPATCTNPNNEPSDQTLQGNMPFTLVISPPHDDTYLLGTQVFPGASVTPYVFSTYPVGGQTFSLSVSNVRGTVLKVADDSGVTWNDAYGNATILKPGGQRDDTAIPLSIRSDGTFRSTISPTNDAPHGIQMTVEPQQDDAPGTFDDTFAATTRTLTAGSLASTQTVTMVMPRVNFWGIVKTKAGAVAPQTGVDGYVGSGNAATPILWSRSDSSGIVRLYIDRSLTGTQPDDSPVTFNLNFDPGGQSKVTAMLADDSGNTSSSPMVLQPPADNFRVTVMRDGVPDVGANVEAGRCCEGNFINGATTDGSGHAYGYDPDVTSPVWVQVTPSPTAASLGYSSFARDVTPVSLGGGLYGLNVELLTDNLTITVQAGGSPAAGAEACLNRLGGEWIGCRTTDSSGIVRFGVSDLSAQYDLRVTPSPALVTAGYASSSGNFTPQVSGGQGTYSVSLSLANVAVTVRNESNTPMPQAFVWLQPMGPGMGSGAHADSNGVVRFSVDPGTLDGPFFMNVSPPWEQRSTYGERIYNNARLTCPDGGGPCTFDAQIQPANALFKVVKPQSGSPAMPNVNLEFRKPDAWMQEGNAFSDQNGFAAATLSDDTYDLFVNQPQMSSDDTIYAQAKYTVVVSGGAVTSVTRKGVPATQSGGRWIVSPVPAIYTAIVRDPNNTPQAFSWVEVMRTVDGWNEYYTGSPTNGSGRVGFSLEDDTYVLRARVPYGQTGLAQSRDCTLVILNQEIGSGTTCGDDIMLRSPNLRVRMVDPSLNAVGSAWACVGREYDWNWSCEGSDSGGFASFLVDDTQGYNQDRTLDGPGRLTVEGNPPFGSDDYATTRHFVDDDSFTGVATLDDTLMFEVPNVRVQLSLNDDTQDAMWSWVSIIRIVSDTNWEWVGGSPANSDGLALFSIDDTSGEFCVEAYPPWERREEFGSKSVCQNNIIADGYEAIDLRTANVSTSVTDSEGRLNQFGWAEIQQGGTRSGSGLDERGRFAAALDAGTYEITFYPGWQRTGSPKTVTVVVNNDGTSNIPSSVQLGSGNVQGSASQGGTPYAGVIVIATKGSSTVTAVTGPDGTFLMELDSGTWTITTIVPPSGAAATLAFASGGTWNGSQLVVP